MAAHRDDPLGAELFRGEHAEEADRSVPDDGDGFAGPGFGGDGGEPAGAEHVGGGEQRGHEVGVRHAGGGDQGAVGERDPKVLRLPAGRRSGLAVDAVGLVAGGADLAGVVGGEERADHELAGLHDVHFRADLFDDADVLVSHGCGLSGRVIAPVGPQVRPADAGRGEPQDRVRRFDDRGPLTLLDAHVSGSVHHDSTHGSSTPLFGVVPVSQ